MKETVFENSYIMYIYVPNGIRNSYAKRDRNWSRTYHSLPYAQTDNYDPIKTRRYETGVGAKTLEKFRISGEGVGGGGGEGRNKYEILWIILLEGVQFGRCSPERWIFCSSFSILRSGLARRIARIRIRVGSLPGKLDKLEITKRARVPSTNHRELLEILLKRRRLCLVHEITVLVDALRRQVRWTRVTRGAGRRRWIIAVAQRAPLRSIPEKKDRPRIIFLFHRTTFFFLSPPPSRERAYLNR